MAPSSRVIGRRHPVKLGEAPRLTKLPDTNSSLARQHHPDDGNQVPIHSTDSAQGHDPGFVSSDVIPTTESLPLPMTGRTNSKHLPSQTIDNAGVDTEEGGEIRGPELQEEEEEEGWYQVRCIIGEKTKKKDTWYRVVWANDPKTGKEYEPSWQETKLRAAERKDRKKRQSSSRASVRESVSRGSTDNSQPVASPNFRKRQRINVEPPQSSPFRTDSWTSEFSEDDTRPTKVPKLDRSFSLNSDEALTEDASDILVNSSRPNISVDIYDRVAFDTSEYIGVAISSQDTTSQPHSQSISAPEDEDTVLALGFAIPKVAGSQRIVPDSQDDTSLEASHTQTGLDQVDTAACSVSQISTGQPDGEGQQVNIVAAEPLTNLTVSTTDTQSAESDEAPHNTGTQGNFSPQFHTQPEFPTDWPAIQSSADSIAAVETVPQTSSQQEFSRKSVPSQSSVHVQATQSDNQDSTAQPAQVVSSPFPPPQSEISYSDSSAEHVPDTVLRRPAAEVKTSSPIIPDHQPTPSFPTHECPTPSMDDNKPVHRERDAIEELMEAANAPFLTDNSSGTEFGRSGPMLPHASSIDELIASLDGSNDREHPHNLTASIAHPPLPLIRQLEQAAGAGLDVPASGEPLGGGLMPPEAGDSMPATVTPSELSRSIEPEVFPGPEVEDIAAAPEPSPARTPEIGEQSSLSMPGDSPDTSPFIVTLPFPANIRPRYVETMLQYKREMEKFNELWNEDAPIDQDLVDKIDQLFAELLDLCDYPASLGDEELRKLSVVEVKKYALGTNTKLFFVGRFVEPLDVDKRVLIVARSEKLRGYLEAVVGPHSMKDGDEDRCAPFVQLAAPDQKVNPSEFDIVIGYDSAYTSSAVAKSLQNIEPGKQPMVVHLVIAFSIDHFEVAIPTDMEELARKSAMLVSLFQSRSYVSSYEGQPVDDVVTEFVKQAIELDPHFVWEPEELPSILLDYYGSTQRTQTQSDIVDDTEPRKRKLDAEDDAVAKRLRRSPSPTAKLANTEAGIHDKIAPAPSQVRIVMTKAELNALNAKISALESQLKDKEDLEAIMHKQISRMSDQLKSYDSTHNTIQEKHMSALSDRASFERERNQALEREKAALARLEASEAKISELEAKLAKASEALTSSGNTQFADLMTKEKELEAAAAQILDLDKKAKNRETELEYMRDVLQNERQAANGMLKDNRELRENNAKLQQQVAQNLAKVHHINAKDGLEEMQRLVVEARAVALDRENELERVREEIKTLKNGRRETRGASVPRSPRMGVMSPRTGRGNMGMAMAGAGATPSRGTSPALAGLDGGSQPAAQLFNQPTSGRFNHLKGFP
ncbi:hypothetical protein ACRALDRAFT_1078748 [Sodiomyces alcalophilus JCM 7366]|uniref:uncharacterized protein n=1 Tax=Sodiomyces alcalophilus JCM 7366 TaxID=591952 RepID=UPI0039B4B430